MNFKDYIKQRQAYTNGVCLNKEMVKEFERREIEKEYIFAKEFTEGYNDYSKFVSENNISSKFSRGTLRAFKYALYYDWDYY